MAVVVFVNLLKAGGLFNLGSGVRPTKSPWSREGPAPEVTITNDQVYVPSVPHVHTARPAEGRVPGDAGDRLQYSDNYDPGQVMAQELTLEASTRNGLSWALPSVRAATK